MEFSELAISQITDLPGEIRVFRLEGGKIPKRRPGQYVTMKIGEIERSYSLSGPVDAPYLEVAIRLAGVFTHLLFGLKEGDKVLVSESQGRFVFDEEKVGSSEIVFLAGGVGITPFSCISEYIKSRGLSNKICLIYGSRKPSEIILKERIEGIFSGLPNGKIVYTVDSSEPGWTGRVGFIDRELVEGSVPNPIEAKYFICGPPPMVKALVSILKEMGVPLQNVTLEGW